jgi:tetratricopeptide (TPR) repeat protein
MYLSRHDFTQRTKSAFLLLASVSLLVCLTNCAGVDTAATSGSGMAEANRLYEAGQYAEAAASYQALVDASAEDGALYYNLGNAYYKAGDLGRAILNYRRAQSLLPRDQDVAANLRIARSQTQDLIDQDREGPLVATVGRLFRWITLYEAALATLMLWFFLCGLLIAAILRSDQKRILLTLAGIAAAFFALGVLSVGIRLLDETDRAPAVVVGDAVSVRSGPGQEYLAEFNLHAGAEVRMVERRQAWARIALPGDLQGWVPEDTVVRVTE